MQNEELDVTTNAPTPSRTIRISHEGDYNLTVNHGVTQVDNSRKFLVFTTVDEAIQAYEELKTENIRASYLTYSLFVKSQAELDKDNLKNQVLSLISNANITYMRVDDNLHTGKVVVDLLADYQTLKAASTDELKFFHFDPKRVRNRRDQGSSEQTSNDNKWPQVQSKSKRNNQSNLKPQRGEKTKPQGGRGLKAQGGRGLKAQGDRGGRSERGGQGGRGSRHGDTRSQSENTNLV